MKPVAIGIAALLASIGTAATAAYDRYGNYYEPRDHVSSDFRNSARVTHVQPVYGSTGVREECVNTRRGQRCRTVETGEQLLGYDVQYSYRGREYTTRMNSDPGSRVVLGRDIREDGTPYSSGPYASAPYANRSYSGAPVNTPYGQTLSCNAASAADRPSWCDQDGQGG